jgi:signal transduction histidine kinase
MVAGISLANKCQLLFGFAVLMILTAALSVPWVLTGRLVHDGQLEAARQLADDRIHTGGLELLPGEPPPPAELAQQPNGPGWRVSMVDATVIDAAENPDTFVQAALRRFRADSGVTEWTDRVTASGHRVYRYARVVPEDVLRSILGVQAGVGAGNAGTAAPAAGRGGGPPGAVLLVDRVSRVAEGQMLRNRIYIVAVGIVAGLLAVLVFYLILTKLILEPVRRLRETTEKVQAGDLAIRSQIRTGDEFQQLSEAFNSMLDRLEVGQGQLQAMNESLDLKVLELSEANIGLYDSNRLKSEFLASVSHELRTPLNSIIGFAEVLEELARSDPAADPKRLRYIRNIMTGGRSLLELINDLLQMAKIEAGRVDVNVEPTSISDLIEGLVGIMRPQAETKTIALETKVARNIPIIETDPGKLQQILYNFLSNAIKFTPEGGTVTITADRLTRQDTRPGVRLAVSDTGPGIPYDMQDAIFEKFRQLDSGHTRQHSGTGLGLAICRELAELLGATVSLVSEPGHGATFIVDLPLTHQPHEPQPLMA